MCPQLACSYKYMSCELYLQRESNWLIFNSIPSRWFALPLLCVDDVLLSNLMQCVPFGNLIDDLLRFYHSCSSAILPSSAWLANFLTHVFFFNILILFVKSLLPIKLEKCIFKSLLIIFNFFLLLFFVVVLDIKRVYSLASHDFFIQKKNSLRQF